MGNGKSKSQKIPQNIHIAVEVGREEQQHNNVQLNRRQHNANYRQEQHPDYVIQPYKPYKFETEQFFLNTNEVKKLQQCAYSVDIKNWKDIRTYRQQIIEFLQKKQEFQIKITFYWIDELEGKIEIMEMIDSLGCNHRVSEVDLRLYGHIKLTNQLIGAIVLRFTNISYIGVLDQNNQVEQSMHNQIISMLRCFTLIEFRLVFNHGELTHSSSGVKLIKQYNKIMEDQQYLRHLYYEHDQLKRGGYTVNDVQSLIKDVDRL